MRGAYILDVEALLVDIGQRLLDEGAVLPDDAGVVAHHLIEVGLAVGEVAIEDMTTQRAEGAEGISREEEAVGLLVGEHHLGPVYHRSHQEGELMATDTQRIAALDLVEARRDAMEATEHIEGLLIPHDLHIGVALTQEADRATVVRLHVVDDQIIHGAALQDEVELVEEDIRVADVDRIDEGRLLVYDEVGVVSHARGDRPDVLEALFHAVVHADVVDGVSDLRYLVHSP